MREYEYCVYNFQDTPRAAHAKGQMAQQEADGWTIHTASPGYSELCVLWVRDVASEDDEPADGEVQVRWTMTPAESDQLFGVLRQHADVPYIARLLAEGAVPPAEAPVQPEPAE